MWRGCAPRSLTAPSVRQACALERACASTARRMTRNSWFPATRTSRLAWAWGPLPLCARGHLILLGDIRVRVLEVKRFADAAELLQHFGFHRVIPEAVALDEAVGVFSAIRGHDEKVQRDGMIGFVFDVAKDDDVALNDEQ